MLFNIILMAMNCDQIYVLKYGSVLQMSCLPLGV